MHISQTGTDFVSVATDFVNTDVLFCWFWQIIQSNSTHKTQLMELSLMREEEKQNYKRQEENMVRWTKSCSVQFSSATDWWTNDINFAFSKLNSRVSWNSKDFSYNVNVAPRWNRS